MRIRTIKPEWLDDERLVLADSDARVLSIALILLADDYGRGRANRTVLEARVFPGKIPGTLAKALDTLRTLNFVLLYEVDGQSYFTIRNWTKHQKVDKPGKPQVPEPITESRTSENPPESLAKIPESLATDQDQEGTRKGPGACNAREGSSVDAETVRAEYLTRWSRATDRQAPLIARGPGSSVWLELSREAGDAASLAKLLDAAFADDFVASTGWTPAAIRGSAQRLLATGAKRNTQRGMVRAATAAEHAADADDELPLEEQLKRFQRRGGHA